MKKHFLKSFALLAMLFSALTLSAQSGVDWSVATSVIGTEQYKVAIVSGEANLQFVNNIQKPGFASEEGIHIVFTKAITECSLVNGTGCATEGGGMIMYLSALTARETKVIVKFGTEETILWVYNADGTTGGSSEPETQDTEVPTLTSVELFGAAQNFVLLTPTASDNKGVTSYLITPNGGAEKEVTLDNAGKIKIEGLTLDKSYTYSVKAKDAAGNVSAAKEITFSTLDRIFCEEEILPNVQFTTNQKLTFTAKKVSNTETLFTLTSSTSTLTKMFNVNLTNAGSGVLPAGYVWKDDWTLTDNTLSKTVTWETYPTNPITIAITANRTPGAGESNLIGLSYSMDISNTCGEDPVEPELEPSTYCQTPLTVGTNTIYLTTEKVSDGNYRMTVEGENLSGFGGTFYNPGAKDLRDAITSQTSTKIICDIAAASAPIFYTPLYVNMPGEVNFSELNGKNIVWGKCEVSSLAYSDLAIVSPSTLSHSLAIGETFTIGLSTSSTGAITYTSSNTDVAEVSASGVITAKAVGTTTITVSQTEDASYQAGEKSFTLDVIAAAVPSNKGFGTYQGRVDLYDWIGDYAGNNACGQVDLYVVTWGNDILFKAKAVEAKFEGAEYMAQLRTRNADLSDGIRESWGKAVADDGATRYSEYGNTYNNHSGLVGYGETFKMWSYMVIAGCGARTIKTMTYTRDHINNPIADNTAPTLSGTANVTSTAENVTIALPAVTSEEVFYMIKDEAHNKQYISITPSFVLPQDGSGITYTYSCYAVDFNGNMSAPLTAEVSMEFNATSNLALNKPSQAGFEANNMGASKANDGKTDSRWASGGGNNPTDAWWYVDLGESYNLSTIEISWEGAYASDYVIMGSDEYIDPANTTAWQTATTLVAKTTAPTVGNNTQEVYSVTGQHARYIRLQANTLANNGWGCSFWEFRVFGTGVYDPSAAADTEKPVITSATPKTPIAHNEVQITMEASDNVGVVAYEVSGSGVSATCVPVDNVITVSNLQEQTTYNLSIVAVDAVGNKSDAYAMAAFTTGVNPYIPHASAPVPTRDAEDVLAFYSDAYTPVINLWGKNQWAGVNFSENNIAGNNYLHYAGNITNLGWEFGVNAGANVEGISTGVDCSAMEYLHIDIWGFENGTIRVIPVWGGTDLVNNKGLNTNADYYAEVQIKEGEWNSVDIPLATGFQPESKKHDFKSIFQFKFAECNNTVAIDNVYFWKSAGTAPVESVTLDKTTATIEVDEALQLKATVLPMEAANKNVVWTSSDATVATVVDGLVTGLKEGTATITATSEEDNTKLATCAITVEPITVKTWWGGPVTLTLAGQEHYVLYSFTRNENKTITYTAIFDQGNIDVVKQVSISDVWNGLQWIDAEKTTASWTSTSTHNAGEKILGFFYFGGPRINFDTEAIAYIVGSSNERPILSVESVTLDKTSCELMPTETAQLVATINPGYVANKNVVWTSSNTAVATVDANGLVTAVAAGSATITATSEADNTKTATCTVNVMAELTDATYHANAFFKAGDKYVGVNYTITRTAERKLRYEGQVHATVEGLVMQYSYDGVTYYQMPYNNETKSYVYTEEATSNDGDVKVGFFYPTGTFGASRWDYSYTVGSTNSPVLTMVGINDQEEGQTTRLEAYTSPVDVVIARAFTDEYWQTISLPFTLDATQITEIFGDGTQVLEFAKAVATPDLATNLGFLRVNAIQASTPYLIKPTKKVGAGTVLRDVTLETTLHSVKVENVTMHPLLDKVSYDYTTDNVLFFLGSDSYLYYQATGNVLLGLRAYFTFEGVTSMAQASQVRARVVFGENETTSLDNITNNEAPTKMIQNGQLIIIRDGVKYNVQGQKL